MDKDEVQEIACQFGVKKLHTVKALPKGKVHETFQLETNNGTYILQRLKPPYNENTILDGAAFTSHLIGKGFPVPSFKLTPQGDPFIRRDRYVYRLMTFIPGRTLNAVDTPVLAKSAGELIGKLHKALDDFSYTPLFRIAGFHDARLALKRLNDLIERNQEKARCAGVLFQRLRREIERLRLREDLPPRRIHGDLKYTNILFDDFSRAVALLDFDTLMIASLPIELGDAFRSWCTRKEGPRGPYFDVELFEGAWRGYMSVNPPLTESEREAIVSGIKYILLELGCRYFIDFFEDFYFAWDSGRFPSREAHNLARATRQLTVFDDVTAKEPELRRIIRAAQ